MDRPKLEVADIFRRYGQVYRDKHGASLSCQQRRVMHSIEVCRTAALGGHLERCDQCGHERNAFNSCRDRHCPKCQSLARAQWIQDRQSELLEVPYFHVVFTVPEEIAAIAYQNKRVVYDILFRTTAETSPPSLPIPSTSEPRSVSSPCFTVGDRTFSFTRTCIVSCPAVGYRPMVNGGSRVVRTSLYLSGFCRSCSDACSWNPCRGRSIPENYVFLGACTPWVTPPASPNIARI